MQTWAKDMMPMSDSFWYGRLRSGCYICQDRSLTKRRGVVYTLSSSAAEAADVVAERNPRASEFEDQRCKLSTPIAPSSLMYFCINSIVINESALISPDWFFGSDIT